MKRVLLVPLLAAALAAAAMPAHADEDAVQFGSDINVSADHAVQDAVCFFCNVHLDGEAKGDIVVFFGNVDLAGQAHHDVANFFGNVTAADNSAVGGDMVNFFGAVRLGENVRVSHDLVAFFSSLHQSASSSIGGDRVVPPFWIISMQPLILGLIILVVVYEVRASHRRRLLYGYPLPPLR
jgi:hypothetical protein